MSKVTKFRMGKGVTVERKKGEESHWTKKSLTLEVEMTEKQSDENLAVALTRTEYILDSFLGTPEALGAAEIPNFDAEDLMKHGGWKAKKKDDGSYADGSLSWGWEFANKFSKETIQALERGPVEIDKYVFSLNEERTLVSAKKKKGE